MTPTSSLRFGAPLLLLAVVLASSTASSRSFAARASITRPGSVSATVSFPAGGLFRVGRGGSSPDSTTGSTILASNNNEVSAPEDDVEVVVPSPAPASSSKMGPKAAPPGLLRRLLPSFPWHTLPDSLTYLRCMAIPLLVVLFYIPKEIANRNVWVSLLFAGASITDWADGYLARRLKQESAWGAFMDPVADKVLVCGCCEHSVDHKLAGKPDYTADIIVKKWPKPLESHIVGGWPHVLVVPTQT